MNWYTVLIQSSAQGPHFLEVHCTCAPHTCVPYGAYLKQSTYYGQDNCSFFLEKQNNV